MDDPFCYLYFRKYYVRKNGSYIGEWKKKKNKAMVVLDEMWDPFSFSEQKVSVESRWGR